MAHREYIRETDNHKLAFLFIHGIVGTPDHFNAIIDIIPNEFSIYNILLDGHGKKIEDFANTSMKKWEEQIEKTTTYLFSKFEKIVIVGHSMGTLFAIDIATKHPDKVEKLFLLAVPLTVFVKPVALKSSLKVAFDKVDENDDLAVAMKYGASVELEPKLWKYASWAPRFIELLLKIKDTEKMLENLTVQTIAIQSKKDELVTEKSFEILWLHQFVEAFMLKRSGHYFYEKSDLKIILKLFKDKIL